MKSAEINLNQTITKSNDYCANCGRPAHSEPLYEQMIDGDNKPILIEVCKYYRKMKKEKTNEVN